MDSSPIISGKDRTSQSDKNTNSYKTGSALDFAAKNSIVVQQDKNSPRAAAASSNELQTCHTLSIIKHSLRKYKSLIVFNKRIFFSRNSIQMLIN